MLLSSKTAAFTMHRKDSASCVRIDVLTTSIACVKVEIAIDPFYSKGKPLQVCSRVFLGMLMQISLLFALFLLYWIKAISVHSDHCRTIECKCRIWGDSGP